VTRREIVEKLDKLVYRCRSAGYTTIEDDLVDVMIAINALPGPEADPAPYLHGTPWPPGGSMVAIVPGDCLISLKAAIEAGARIVIEPANPEAD
jgi:hypothetical protein